MQCLVKRTFIDVQEDVGVSRRRSFRDSMLDRAPPLIHVPFVDKCPAASDTSTVDDDETLTTVTDLDDRDLAWAFGATVREPPVTFDMVGPPGVFFSLFSQSPESILAPTSSAWPLPLPKATEASVGHKTQSWADAQDESFITGQ